jgi:hypothetical protein
MPNGTYYNGVYTIVVADATLYVGTGNTEKVVTVTKVANNYPLNPYFMGMHEGKMIVSGGISDFQRVFVFDIATQEFESIKSVSSVDTNTFIQVNVVASSAISLASNVSAVTMTSASGLVTTNLTSFSGYTTLSQFDPSYNGSNTSGITFLLTGQTVRSQNGLYTTTGAGPFSLSRTSAPLMVSVQNSRGYYYLSDGESDANRISYTKHTDARPFAYVFDGVPVYAGDRVLFRSGITSTSCSDGTTVFTSTQATVYEVPLVSWTGNSIGWTNSWKMLPELNTQAEMLTAKVQVLGGTTYSGLNFYQTSTATMFSGANATGGTWVTTKPTDDATNNLTSNMVVAHGKVWGVTKMNLSSQPQKVISYDYKTNTKTSFDLPVRPSSARSWVAPGYNGFVYIANYNNFSVTKVDAETGAPVSVIRLNSSPTRIFTDANRRIWVSSYGGMLSLIDYDDDQVHNDYGTENGLLYLFADPTDSAKLWWLDSTGKIVRWDMNTKQTLETEAITNDWNLTCKEFTTLQDSGQLFVSPPVTYSKEDGTSVSVKPYVFARTFVSASSVPLIAFKLDDTYLYRDASCEVNGVAAIVDGTQEYFGE